MESIDRDSRQAVLNAYDSSKSTKETSGLTRADVNQAAQVLGMTSMQAKDISALSAIGLEAETQGVVRLGLGMVLMSTNSQIKALRKIEEKLDNAEFDEEPDQLIAAAKVAGDLWKNIASNGKTLAVGANMNDNKNGQWSGHVRVFSLDGDGDGSSWNQLGDDIEGEAVGDISGSSVSLSSDGRTVAI